MIQEPLIKVAVSFVIIPGMTVVGEVVSQIAGSEAGGLIEKFGIIGAFIVFLVYVIKASDSDKKERIAREEKLAEILEQERKAHNAALDALTAAISQSCRFNDHNNRG